MDIESISSATVIFSDTDETYILKTEPNKRCHSLKRCHFFEQFTIGDDNIQLRLDWFSLDNNGHPTLDADFIDKETGDHRRNLKGKRKDAHHTDSLPGKGRYYEWVFDEFSHRFNVKVAWRASASESSHVNDSCLAEVNR